MNRVVVESGGLDHIAAYLRHPCQVALISDETVIGLYGQRVQEALEAGGFSVSRFQFPAGEAHKNLQTYGDILTFLALQRLTRGDMVLALGGGVVSDLAGFAAATYLRGVRWAVLPTTLLSQVDAAIGGKTAVDLPQGKNLAGAFHLPELVLIDPETLDTLPERETRSGMAEVIKYAAGLDAHLFRRLPFGHDTRADVIRRCADIKQHIVQGDPQDHGQRQLLNLGHTFGHAVEHLSNYSLSHGEAVAIGMGIIARACMAKGLLRPEDGGRLLNILETAGLPTGTDMDGEAIFHVVCSDKKRQGETITLVLLHGIGDARLTPMALQDARAFLMAGLAR